MALVVEQLAGGEEAVPAQGSAGVVERQVAACALMPDLASGGRCGLQSLR